MHVQYLNTLFCLPPNDVTLTLLRRNKISRVCQMRVKSPFSSLKTFFGGKWAKSALHSVKTFFFVFTESWRQNQLFISRRTFFFFGGRSLCEAIAPQNFACSQKFHSGYVPDFHQQNVDLRNTSYNVNSMWTNEWCKAKLVAHP